MARSLIVSENAAVQNATNRVSAIGRGLRPGIPVVATMCATAASMFTMAFTLTSEAVQHFFANQTNFEYALLLALGTVLGAQVGACASKKTSGKNLRRIFGVVMVIMVIQVILKYV